MDQKDDLLQKREELKSQIDEGKYRSLADIILDSIIGRSLQKLTSASKPVSLWFSGIVMALITLLIGILASTISGEFYSLQLAVVPGTMWAASMGLLIVVGAKVGLRLLLNTLYEDIVDSIESVVDLDDLRDELGRYGNVRLQLLFSLGLGLIALMWPLAWREMGASFPGVGPTLVVALVWFQSGPGVYLGLLSCVTPHRLGRYQLELHTTDPGGSKAVRGLSNALNGVVFIGAVLLTAFTFGLAFILQALSFSLYLFWLLGGWGFLLMLFFNNQYALARIIAKAKWEKLNEIQTEIEKLEAQGDIASKETMEAIERLRDYYDWIKTTPSSALDIGEVLRFLQTLLLPLIASLLANLKRVIELFSVK
jgi:hypothetical protein